tara:strand:+ start:1072 stop:2028 length:957 start_codon:yes stop_codon:yes gene_type:complete
MRLNIWNQYNLEVQKKINFGFLKRTFFYISLLYFFIYFFKNIDQVSFAINIETNGINLFLSLLFCIFSIYFNAYAWKFIVIWFGKNSKNNNLVSFYVLTNVLKYVPGGIWHFVERFNFIKKISNAQLAFYSTLIEPYFMLCGAFLLASLGIIFSPLYLLFLLPLIFLNRKLIYIVLERLENLKVKASKSLNFENSKNQFERKINLNSFFPTSAFLLEIGFVLSKFIGFYICLNTFNTNDGLNIFYLLVIFSLSWSLGLIVPAAPSGVGIFEACILFFIGKNIPQHIIFVTLIYFRVISTSADLMLSFPFIIRRFLKKV